MQPFEPVDPAQDQAPQAYPVQSQAPQVPQGYISRAELEEILSARDAKFREDLAKRDAEIEKQRARARALVTSPVATHGGGPGVENHRESWSLVEQEAARRGEWLDHWGDKPED